MRIDLIKDCPYDVVVTLEIPIMFKSLVGERGIYVNTDGQYCMHALNLLIL